MKKLSTLLRDIVHDAVLAPVLFLGLGAFFGIMVINANFFQASLFQADLPSILNEREVIQMFTEVQNIRDIEITNLSAHTFLVEFFATEGNGDSLHPFQYIVTKDGDILVDIKEVSTPSPSTEIIVTEPIDVEIQ